MLLLTVYENALFSAPSLTLLSLFAIFASGSVTGGIPPLCLIPDLAAHLYADWPFLFPVRADKANADLRMERLEVREGQSG